jgi:hypothetical protein
MAHGRTGPAYMCSTPGCNKRNGRQRFSVMCDACRQRRIKCGHPAQFMIRLRDLVPYREEAAEILEKNRGSKVVEVLHGRWNALHERAQYIKQQWEAGRAVNKHERQFAEIIIELTHRVEVEEILKTVISIHLHREDRPGFYRSDESFKFLRNNILMRLSKTFSRRNEREGVPGAHGATWSYTRVRVRTQQVGCLWISEAFDDVLIYIAKRKQQKKEEDRREKEAFLDALAELKLD